MRRGGRVGMMMMMIVMVNDLERDRIGKLWN